MTELITADELIKRAAAFKDLKVGGNAQGTSRIIVITTCQLDEETLDFLAERGMESIFQPEGLYITDEETEKSLLLSAKSGEIRVSLAISFIIDAEKREIVFVPKIRGNIKYADTLVEQKLFYLLTVKNQKSISLAAWKILDNDGHLSVSWEEIGLNGIIPIGNLFSRFLNERKSVIKLSRSNTSPFCPNPNQEDVIFVTEPGQRKIPAIWEKQLREYEAQLALI